LVNDDDDDGHTCPDPNDMTDRANPPHLLRKVMVISKEAVAL